jgi:hypothetical protein
MSRVLSAVLVVALGSGCTTSHGARLGTLTGIGLVSVGLILQADTFGDSGGESYAPIAPLPLGIGAIVLGVSLYVLATATDEDAPEAPKPAGPDPQIAERAKVREHAWTLTKQAMEAGRADDCAPVVKLDLEVRALDAEFYTDVFARDRGIARCLPQR